MVQETGDPQSQTHFRLAKCGSRQVIQTRPDHSNRMVSPSRGLPVNMQHVEPTSNRSICQKAQQQVAFVCVTDTGPPSLGSRCTQPAMGGSGCICLPAAAILGKEAAGLPMQDNHSNCPRMAQHALVLGSSGHVKLGPSGPAQSAQPAKTALQSDSSQESSKPKSAYMTSRVSAIKEQVFSEAVSAQIEAPQRGSTRSVYEAKGTIFTKWCFSNQVDFRAPPLKSIADFLLYVFQDWK